MLPLIGICLVIFYSICGNSCSYLKGGMAGIDLKYTGIIYMSAIALFSTIKKYLFILIVSSAGIGVEAFLVGFQIRNDVYCPYCLAFGIIVVLLFILNLDWTKKRLMSFSIIAGVLICMFFFKGYVVPSYYYSYCIKQKPIEAWS